MQLFVPRRPDGERWAGANTRPVGVGAAALGFGGRKPGLL